MNILERTASHVVLYTVFSLALIYVGFLFATPISFWSLPFTYVAYLLMVLGVHRRITFSGFLLSIIVPVSVLLATHAFTLTFDSSYDGQGYHSTAIINLSNGWIPIGDHELLFNHPESTPFVTGYPKSLWIMQTGLYMLVPTHMNAATVTNLIIVFLALIFTYGFLVRLAVPKYWAIFLSMLAVLQPTLIQQFFTFMADGFSYGLTLIAISVLGIFIIDQDKKMPLAAFLAAEILLATTKYTNLFIFGVLGLIGGIYLLRLILNSTEFNKLIVGFMFSALIILWLPYGNNLVFHGSTIYPSNQTWARNNVIEQNMPNNLAGANKLTLLFYGIYSKAQPASAATSEHNVAELKIPFTTSRNEIAITNNFQGRVGSEGVLFSGLITISAIIMASLFMISKSPYERKALAILSVTMAIIVVAALLNPVPNKLRYTPTFYLLPVLVLLGVVLFLRQRKSITMATCAVTLSVVLFLNLALKITPSAHARLEETKLMRTEIELMRISGIMYEVTASKFYSNYIRLREHGVELIETDNAACSHPHPLALSGYTTLVCPAP